VSACPQPESDRRASCRAFAEGWRAAATRRLRETQPTGHLLGTSDSVETTVDERGAHRVDWGQVARAQLSAETSSCRRGVRDRALSWIGLGRSTKPNESTALRRGRPVETSLERLVRAEMRRYPIRPNARSPADSGCSLGDPCRSAIRPIEASKAAICNGRFTSTPAVRGVGAKRQIYPAMASADFVLSLRNNSYGSTPTAQAVATYSAGSWPALSKGRMPRSTPPG
jgi:hypothetical protein